MSGRRVGADVVGTVFDIQRFSVHDGPGIRTTVFLKGCRLECRWCHNPQGISPVPRLAYRSSRCYGCGECVAVCPRDALAVCGGVVRVAWERCDHCGRCVAACVTGALEMAGREMSAAEVIETVARDEPFYRASGGGMTLGGGEPLAQPEFTLSLLALAGERGIHRAVDTSGHAPWEDLESVALACDLILYDLKTMDPQRHRELTGADNALVLDNARRLAGMSAGPAGSGVPIRLRVPVIPGLTDDDDNLRAIAGFARRLGALARQPGGVPVDLLPYHRLTESVYRVFGMPYALSGLAPPSRERMARLREIVEGETEGSSAQQVGNDKGDS